MIRLVSAGRVKEFETKLDMWKTMSSEDKNRFIEECEITRRFHNSENTGSTSDASHKSGSYKTVRDSNAPRADTDSDSKASVDGSLEKITDTEKVCVCERYTRWLDSMIDNKCKACGRPIYLKGS